MSGSGDGVLQVGEAAVLGDLRRRALERAEAGARQAAAGADAAHAQILEAGDGQRLGA